MKVGEDCDMANMHQVSPHTHWQLYRFSASSLEADWSMDAGAADDCLRFGSH